MTITASLRRGSALVGAVVASAGLLTAGAVVGTGTAHAATPPSISVGFSGANEWTIAWDGTPAASCDAFIDGSTGPTLAAGSGVVVGLAPGTHSVAFECDGKRSNKLYLYAPRGPLNDLRTQFSNGTQGMFGS